MSKKKDDGDLAWLALDLLPQVVLIARRSGSIIFRNLEAEKALPPGDHVAAVLCDVDGIGPDWACDVAAIWEEPTGLVHRNVSLAGAGSRRLLADVYIRRLPCLAEPVQPPESDAQAVLVVVEDVSGRASAERRLVASERLAAQAKAAARMAHELNNPLDGVLRYIGLAQRLVEGQAAEYLTAARDGLLRMAGIIHDMLSSGPAGGGPRETIERLLQEAVLAFAPRAAALGVAVVYDLAEDGGAEADARMFQVFCNVIKNALDAMPNGGTLTIRARLCDGQCVLAFTDTGCGLTQEQARRVFEPFYTTKPTGQGVGLGLTVCREIITALGGTIAADPGPGGGTIVAVTLPVRMAAVPVRDARE
jgi:signal transduction histidine kinase